MTTKEYLGQISRLNRMINNKLIELAQLKELACSISAVSNEERVMTTPNFDKIGTKQAKIDEIERKIKELPPKDKYEKLIESVTASDIIEVSNRYFNENHVKTLVEGKNNK